MIKVSMYKMPLQEENQGSISDVRGSHHLETQIVTGTLNACQSH